MTKLSPQHQAWRRARSEKYAADRQVEHRLTLSEDMEASEGFLAGAEAEHEAAKLLGGIEALEFAIAYSDGAYAGMFAEKTALESRLYALLGR